MRDKKSEKLVKEMEGLIKRSRELKRMDSGCGSLVQERGTSVVLIDRENRIIFCNDFSKAISRVISGVEMEKGRSFFDFVTGRDAEYCRRFTFFRRSFDSP